MKNCTNLVEFSVSQAFLMLMYVADRSLSSILTCSDCLPRAQALTELLPLWENLLLEVRLVQYHLCSICSNC